MRPIAVAGQAAAGKFDDHGLQERQMLEKVEVAPLVLLGVVDLARHRAFGARELAAAGEVQADIQPFLRSLELKPGDLPGRLNPQRLREPRVDVHRLLRASERGKPTGTQDIYPPETARSPVTAARLSPEAR